MKQSNLQTINSFQSIFRTVTVNKSVQQKVLHCNSFSVKSKLICFGWGNHTRTDVGANNK